VRIGDRCTCFRGVVPGIVKSPRSLSAYTKRDSSPKRRVRNDALLQYVVKVSRDDAFWHYGGMCVAALPSVQFG
jgi:hypothetical protein